MAFWVASVLELVDEGRGSDRRQDTAVWEAETGRFGREAMVAGVALELLAALLASA